VLVTQGFALGWYRARLWRFKRDAKIYLTESETAAGAPAVFYLLNLPCSIYYKQKARLLRRRAFAGFSCV
jgi:hypothetical protein